MLKGSKPSIAGWQSEQVAAQFVKHSPDWVHHPHVGKLCTSSVCQIAAAISDNQG